MMLAELNRRKFLKTPTAAGVGALAVRYVMRAGMFSSVPSRLAAEAAQSAKPGGKPAWPIFDVMEEPTFIDVLRSKKWFGGEDQTMVKRFD